MSPRMVAVAALILAAALVGLGFHRADWNPTVYVGFGEDAVAITEYAEERLGEVVLRPEQGHDGKFFFVQANDPWMVDPGNHAAILDHPIYRSQRMLYPLISGGLGLFEAETAVWALAVVNVAAIGLGTLATSRISAHSGKSPLWGLAFAANIGLLFTLTNDSADILAAALAFWAVAMIYENRLPAAIVLLAGAVLTREVMIVCAVGIALWLWLEGRRKTSFYSISIPAVAIGLWLLYLRAQLGPDDSSPSALGLPFVGLARAIPSWLDDPVVLAAGGSVLLLMVLYLLRWSQTRTVLGWAFVGFIPLATLLTERVWGEIFDFTRALAPLLTAAILLIFVESKSRDGRWSDEHHRLKASATR